MKVSNGGRLTKEEKEKLASYCEQINVSDTTAATIGQNDRSAITES